MHAARIIPLLVLVLACGSGSGGDPVAAAAALKEGHAATAEVRGPEDIALVERALVAFARAAESAPDGFEAHYWAGRSAAQANHGERAVGYLRRATELDPEHADAWRRLAAEELGCGRPDEAAAALRQARTHGEESAELCYLEGTVAQLAGDDQTAADRFRAASALEPTWPQPYFGLANALRRAGADDAAERAMASFQQWTGLQDRAKSAEKRARTHPEDAGLCEEAGIALYGVRELGRASEWLDRALRLDDARSRAHHFRGLLHHEDKQLDEARAHLERAIELDPIDAAPRRELAWVHASAGRVDAALTTMQESVTRAEDAAAANYDLGILCLELARTDLALGAFELALELDETHVQAHLGAAQVKYVSGDKLGAKKHWRRVLELQPGHPGAMQSLSVLAQEGIR